MTGLWILIALCVGFTLGFALFAALSIASEEQRKESRARLPLAMSPMESDLPRI
jgi:hypothetical protein